MKWVFNMHELYEQLLRVAGFENQDEAEVQRQRDEGFGFDIILNSPLTNVEDLVRIIHMVYAWMPKMLRSFNVNIQDTDLDNLFRYSFQARQGIISIEDERELFVRLARLTNNRMVGASKVLMVLNQNRYPIFDDRVKTSWNIFFRERRNLNVATLTNLSVAMRNGDDMVANYKYYQNTLSHWALEINRPIRDIEYLFWKSR